MLSRRARRHWQYIILARTWCCGVEILRQKNNFSRTIMESCDDSMSRGQQTSLLYRLRKTLRLSLDTIWHSRQDSKTFPRMLEASCKFMDHSEIGTKKELKSQSTSCLFRGLGFKTVTSPIWPMTPKRSKIACVCRLKNKRQLLTNWLLPTAVQVITRPGSGEEKWAHSKHGRFQRKM